MWILLGVLIWLFLCGTIVVTAGYAVSVDEKEQYI